MNERYIRFENNDKKFFSIKIAELCVIYITITAKHFKMYYVPIYYVIVKYILCKLKCLSPFLNN